MPRERGTGPGPEATTAVVAARVRSPGAAATSSNAVAGARQSGATEMAGRSTETKRSRRKGAGPEAAAAAVRAGQSTDTAGSRIERGPEAAAAVVRAGLRTKREGRLAITSKQVLAVMRDHAFPKVTQGTGHEVKFLISCEMNSSVGTSSTTSRRATYVELILFQ